MRCLENDIKLQRFQKVPLLSYRNIGGQKTTSIFESFQKSHKLVEFHSSKRKKERLPLFRSRRSFGIIQFLLHQPDQQLVHVFCRLAAGQQLVPKGQHHARQQPALIGA